MRKMHLYCIAESLNNMDIVGLIGKIPGAKPVLRKLFRKQFEERVRKSAELSKQLFIDNGLKAVAQFHKCMEDNGYKYVAAYGTMLGAIREHGFIKHDLDIDFWMWKEDDDDKLVKALEEYGFKLYAHYSIDNDRLGKEYTFSYNGCHADVFFIYPPINAIPYSTLFNIKLEGGREKRVPMRIELPVSRERRLEKFENQEIYVPVNAEELCVLRYGPDYMTPNPGWDWHKSTDSVVVWEDMSSLTTVKHF